MRQEEHMRVLLVGVAVAALWITRPSAEPWSQTAAAPAPAQTTASSPATVALSDAQMEAFLRDGKILRVKGVSKGVTGTVRATLTDGTLTHDAQIQTVDERKAQFDTPGSTEFNFQDSWKFNVAAYRVDRLIGLNMVPVSVARSWRSKAGAFTWWIDDVLMDEGTRLKQNTQPPDTAVWTQQMALVKLFDQLIYNVDRNMGNLLISSTWRLWAIDHTRAFRAHKTLKSPASVTRCDRQVLQGLRQLNRDLLRTEIGDYVTSYEIDGLLARRDKIVEILDNGGPTRLFDRRPY
jgi:hypothetical protein